MSERARKHIVYTLFVGAIGLGLLTRPWEGPRHSAGTGAAVSMPPLVEANAASLAPALPDSPTIWKPATAWPHDPFRGGGRVEDVAPVETPAAESSEPLLTLQGVVTVEGQRVCVINGQSMRVGTVVEGWRIQRIEESQVRLARGTETLDLHLP